MELKINSKQPHYKAYSVVGLVQTNDNCHLYRGDNIFSTIRVEYFFLLLILQTRDTGRTTLSQNAFPVQNVFC